MSPTTKRTHFRFFSRLIPISGLVLISAAALPTDVWRAKPVQQWTEEETRGFLRNSPWVRQVTVGGLAGEIGDAGVDAQTRLGRGGEASGAEGRVNSSTIDVERGEAARRPVYYIEWSSAKIVRAANVHIALLQGRIKQDPGAPPPLDSFVLTVAGTDLQVFTAATEPQLQAASYLRAKHSKTRVPPKEVKILKRENRVVAITFTFPRAVDGQPVIPDQESAAEFTVKIKDLTLKPTFDLNRMVTESGRDL
jgi:hypothetical protein